MSAALQLLQMDILEPLSFLRVKLASDFASNTIAGRHFIVLMVDSKKGFKLVTT